MVGMRDVAKRAGVSVSSVSLVINGTGYVSRDMREKVEQAMRELDYVPNELARNFYHGKTDIIGVIVPTIQHPFFATLTAHLQHEFADAVCRRCCAPPPTPRTARRSTSTCCVGTVWTRWSSPRTPPTTRSIGARSTARWSPSTAIWGRGSLR